jgi:hypothetical protein
MYRVVFFQVVCILCPKLMLAVLVSDDPAMTMVLRELVW